MYQKLPFRHVEKKRTLGALGWTLARKFESAPGIADRGENSERGENKVRVLIEQRNAKMASTYAPIKLSYVDIKAT